MKKAIYKELRADAPFTIPCTLDFVVKVFLFLSSLSLIIFSLDLTTIGVDGVARIYNPRVTSHLYTFAEYAHLVVVKA